MKQLLTSPEVLVITPGKSLDNHNAPEMVSGLVSAQSAGVKFVIIDMTEVEFISSAGVGSMLGTVKMFKEVGGDLILCNVPSPVMQVLKVLDLDTFFTMRNTRADALTLTQVHA